jgi:hypothetical protein
MKTIETDSGRGAPTTAEQMAKGLGWFSLGLGAAELAFPGALGRMLGLGNKEGLIRAYGAREVAAGIGALSSHPAPAMWARAAGDIVDLATLAVGLKAEGDERRNAAIAIAAVAGITIVDLAVAAQLSREAGLFSAAESDEEQPAFPGEVQVGRSVENPAAAERERELEPA